MDSRGFSIWYLNYNKHSTEGKNLFATKNLNNLLLARFDKLRKWSLGKHLIIGDEFNHNITGVWLWRGTEVPQVVKDHPQFEFLSFRKMDIFRSPADEKTLAVYWGAQINSIVFGTKVLHEVWFK